MPSRVGMTVRSSSPNWERANLFLMPLDSTANGIVFTPCSLRPCSITHGCALGRLNYAKFIIKPAVVRRKWTAPRSRRGGARLSGHPSRGWSDRAHCRTSWRAGQSSLFQPRMAGLDVTHHRTAAGPELRNTRCGAGWNKSQRKSARGSRHLHALCNGDPVHLRSACSGDQAPSLQTPLQIAEKYWRSEGNKPKLGEVLAFRSLVAWFQRELDESFSLARQALRAAAPGRSTVARPKPGHGRCRRSVYRQIE